MSPRAALPQDAAALAALHEAAFEKPWTPPEIAGVIGMPGAFGLVIEQAGFILCRNVADEAEVLTLAVDPAARRRGLGRTLVEAATARAEAAGARALFLEVAADNDPALRLYEQAGFAWAGLRRGYYARRTGAMDAIVMRRTLNTAV